MLVRVKAIKPSMLEYVYYQIFKIKSLKYSPQVKFL